MRYNARSGGIFLRLYGGYTAAYVSRPRATFVTATEPNWCTVSWALAARSGAPSESAALRKYVCGYILDQGRRRACSFCILRTGDSLAEQEPQGRLQRRIDTWRPGVRVYRMQSRGVSLQSCCNYTDHSEISLTIILLRIKPKYRWASCVGIFLSLPALSHARECNRSAGVDNDCVL